ncbi:MAG: tetratricopeptide repeat protein [Pseudomonadota bacterium]
MLAAQVPEYQSNLGVMLRAIGKTAEAEAALRRALALRPGYAQALANLGNLLSAEGVVRRQPTPIGARSHPSRSMSIIGSCWPMPCSS